MNGYFCCLLLSLLLLSCAEKTKSSDNSKSLNNTTSPIEGNWELVENMVEGVRVKSGRNQQFKTFNDGFFCFTMQNPDGSFHGSGAGTYSVNGDQYRETFTHYSDTTWIGYSDLQKWEFKGDTLVFSGFKQVIDRLGKELPGAWGG